MAEEKKKEESKEKSSPTSGGSKLGVLLGVVNLLVTLGIGAVVFLQFQKDKHRESVSDISTEEVSSGHGGSSEHGGSGEHGGSSEHGAAEASKETSSKIITLEQFTVNLATTVGTPPRYARVVIAVELASDEVAQELNQKIPQVRNAIIDLFNSKRPADLQTGEGRNFLKEEIKNALNSFLITGKVKGVFFSNFAVNG